MRAPSWRGTRDRKIAFDLSKLIIGNDGFDAQRGFSVGNDDEMLMTI
jgi:hypothetical protein